MSNTKVALGKVNLIDGKKKTVKKKKITPKQWEMAIRKAKQFVSNYDKARWIIAQLAIEVCTIKVGGHSSDTYTLAKFAREIGMERSTLSDWVNIKLQVYDKLTVVDRKNAHTFAYQVFDQVHSMVDENTSPKKVQKYFRDVLQEDPNIRKFACYEGKLNAILHNAQRPLNMMEVPTETIQILITKCNLIASFLGKELEMRKNPVEIQTKKRLNMKVEIQKRLEEEA